ncbi:MAG: peptidase S41 [Flavobacteriales bacterium]|nr:peptidase S41 [Flavobacteriales bacterium]|tara:strand:+ start:1913 stop:3454 length:1542 start_codon:yes stop_codon:yes gene_type:complete
MKDIGKIIVIFMIGLLGLEYIVPQKKYPEGKKINYIINEIDAHYVDSIDINSLIESSIEQTLKNLDPHSYYLNSEEVVSTMEMMQGSFEGIGVEFSINRDTIIIVNVIPGGPSSKKGLQAGERIVKIEDEIVAGVGIKNRDVIQKLRGKNGTQVQIGVQNPRDTTIRLVNITRGEIPLHSLDVAYEIAPNVGYIKLNRFSGTTFQEFKKELESLLKNHQINNLILDLRGNSGGYLDQAINILNEFFSGGELLVYTEGKARKKENYFSNNSGSFKTGGICVLIDEDSASASEIVAGAIQDQDRGIIIGNKSFGKALVQEQISLDDGSLIRLTVARYYTPSGRCIQKPYSEIEIDSDNYFNDSYKIDSLEKFETKSGKVVYGGGGITPDYIIKDSTNILPGMLLVLYSSDFFNNLIFDYVDSKREQLSNINFTKFNLSKNEKDYFLTKIENWLIMELGDNTDNKNIKSEIEKYNQNIIHRLNALIIRQQWGWAEMQMFLNESDEIISTSLSLLKN